MPPGTSLASGWPIMCVMYRIPANQAFLKAGYGDRHWRGWCCFCEHPLVRRFEPYQLGDSEDEGEHRLLVDRYRATLDIGLTRDVEQLLATQPSELHALTAHLSGHEARALLERSLDDAYAERERAHTPSSCRPR
jgi:hypothetical protein